MSKVGGKWECLTPGEVGCKYNIFGGKNTFLVREENSSAMITPYIGQLYRYVGNMFVWNYNSRDGGMWVDVSDLASPYFSIQEQKNSLEVSQLEVDKWAGHLVKIVVGDDDCLVVKVEGNIVYPFDVEVFEMSLLSSTRRSESVEFVSNTERNVEQKKMGKMMVTVETIATVNTTISRSVSKIIKRSPLKDEL